MTDPNTTAAINRILLRTAINADPICDRSQSQKMIRVARLRAELVDLGYSVVTTNWLQQLLDETGGKSE